MFARLLCRVLGHDVVTPWPGTRVYCLRCKREWGFGD